MGIIEALDETSSKAVKTGEDYVQTTKHYFELKVFQQLAILTTSTCKLAVYGILSTLGLIFLAIAGAAALSTYFGSTALGYLCMGGIFFVLVGLVYLVRKKIEKSVIKKLSKNYFD
ncbi:hypothetical protein ACFFU1_10705 [Algibacter miyuki]|uniref:Phage holin family protein n=1 Tax=Algibacter miyuki TaxID=1306933 RepID=A0ABV5H0F2_9FLAO|nr:hypothetical protein [Algibacter miyuki]MDN3667386.1 hypothetical protein [Algibacter miyuki]